MKKDYNDECIDIFNHVRKTIKLVTFCENFNLSSATIYKINCGEHRASIKMYNKIYNAYHEFLKVKDKYELKNRKFHLHLYANGYIHKKVNEIKNKEKKPINKILLKLIKIGLSEYEKEKE